MPATAAARWPSMLAAVALLLMLRLLRCCWLL
jgi:hypothetical protein